jgi:hypothetical protein
MWDIVRARQWSGPTRVEPEYCIGYCASLTGIADHETPPLVGYKRAAISAQQQVTRNAAKRPLSEAAMSVRPGNNKVGTPFPGNLVQLACIIAY